MQATDEPLDSVERVAALDVGTVGLVACLRVPGEGPRRVDAARRSASTPR
jgi:hypothetical protein